MTAPRLLRGSCLCGTIRYEIRGELGPIVLCHCAQCRKAQGSAFAAVAPVRTADFALVAGGHALAEYESSPGKRRAFCRLCGSPIFSRRDSLPGALRLRIGTLDSTLDAKPTAHIFATSKAEWEEIRDDLPQYPAQEPGRPQGK